MGFYYASEKRKFDREWERLTKEYAEAGMSESDIAQMRAFDWDWFRSRRVYAQHNQQFPDMERMEENGYSVLVHCFTEIPDMLADTDYNGWLDTISDEKLHKRLCSLKKTDLELLTLIVMYGYSQVEVAQKLGCAQSTICHRLQRIKRILQKS